MAKRVMATLVVLAFAAGLLSAVALAGEKEDAAQMEAWMKTAKPGPHHAILQSMAGEWNSKITMWESPGADPVVTDGHTVSTMTMDGRFLVEKSDGTMMGMPFKGMGINGYDNITSKHVFVWFDNMGTGILYGEGECTDHCKVVTQYGDMPDPMTGEDVSYRMVTRCDSDDQYTFELYMVDETGKEDKQMEIVYTRAKKAKG